MFRGALVTGLLLSMCLWQVPAQTTKATTGAVATDKPSTFLQELSNLGQGLLLQGIGGAIKAGCNQCPRLCRPGDAWEVVCSFTCGAFCGRFKRSLHQTEGHLTPMPNKFSAYDLNEDGVVSLKELTFVAGQGTVESDVRMVFNMADRNGDGTLTPRELYEGPFVFEMDVAGTDHMYCEYLAKRMGRTTRN